MTHSELQRDVRQLADHLVDVVARQDYDTLAGLVPRVVGRQSPDGRLFRPLLTELAIEVAWRIRALTGGLSARDLFTIGLSAEDETVAGVDELDPPLRATLRAVLAELNDDRENSLVQLDFVNQDPNPLGRMDALLHLVSWVGELR
ncbi:hypothetical protein LWP59_32515 [Amycolatopsis acidiphila]|uniref:Uncharacterized protein n=1 Tax=Amycolatopsis acidiphila TaxID=715473 RepID=A0A558A6G2_9PSEU|nr:hypothetical protein [Amycolatopsis acidiphila]TVT19860.1 hypothetical protein FNH06_22845 [Amycolatopsis acidiphila]UIJ58770.1 hypothetical protein LWP59_32515 [Amycolatopsis acidiphila]GHG71832.1 hypothetical protein GCM10017788_33850 [Amycolatopsis acidiphila]